MAYLLCHAVAQGAGRRSAGLPQVARRTDLVVYNTEARGPLHEQLAPMPGYVASEYFGPEHKSGELVDGVLHQDLKDLSFEDASIDVVLTSDVLEHVPDPYRAHDEIHRVLRPGGRHLFTVPFWEDQHLDDHRAYVDDDGTVVHLKDPIYHGDPVRPAEGALVYTIFALEMLVRLRERGFATYMYRLYAPGHGILGHYATFEAVRLP
jgi:SAM-dependent methyltransferase